MMIKTRGLSFQVRAALIGAIVGSGVMLTFNAPSTLIAIAATAGAVIGALGSRQYK